MSDIVDRNGRGGGFSTRSALLRGGGVLIVLAASGGIGHWAFTGPTPAPKVNAPASIPVHVTAAKTQDVPVWLGGIGTVTPLNVVDVKVRVDGQLQAVDFKEGQMVQPGQALAQIDPRPYQASLAQAQANKQKDLAQLANARQETIRASKLASAGAGTSQNFDAMKAQEAALQATVASDQAAIDTAQLNLEFARITAPLAGRVGLRQIDPGSIVHASDATGLVTITQMAPISVLFSLPQDELATVNDAQRDGEVSVAVDSRDGARHIADGKLSYVNSSVDQNNGQVQLKAVFSNEDRALWPGSFVAARVLVRTDRNAVVVPAQAVLTGETGFYVYAVKPDNTVSAVPVKTGASDHGLVEITSGLQTGQKIVLDGQSRLAPGSHVSELPANPTQGAGA